MEHDLLSELLDQLLDQERRLQLTSFDHDDAWALGQQMVTAARAADLPVTISVRRGRQRLFHAALAGTSADNDDWIERKSRVVDHFGHSSYYVGTLFRSRGTTFEGSTTLDPRTHAAHGGVFPVIIAGVGPVGTVGVSGLPQADDHAFVVQQLQIFLATP